MNCSYIEAVAMLSLIVNFVLIIVITGYQERAKIDAEYIETLENE